MPSTPRSPKITAVLIGLIGLPMIWYGGALLILGGTPYYALTGVLMVVSAIELWRGNPRGFHIFAVLVLITLAWAVYEAGTSFWLVGSRIWVVGFLALWLCSPVVRRGLWGTEYPSLFSQRTVQVCAAATAVVVVGMVADLVSDSVDPVDATVYSDPQNESDWTAYGGSNAGTRFAPHDQINKSTVTQLTEAWTAETGQVGRFSATPIQIRDGLFLCTAQNIIISLDVDTGAERWRFDPENSTPPYGIIGNCRGVTYYKVPDTQAGDHCSERIYTATTDARMIAVDMQTGKVCPDFGESGQISLLAGMGEVKPLYYFVTSPATVASHSLVVGGWVMDNQEVKEPSGVVRGYDPVTGDLLWAWDMGREETGLPPEGSFYTRGTPNVWSLTSSDDELGLVYVPTGNATPDYFGGHRTQVMDKYASSIVAIDAKTGRVRWHYQTAHHDIWDYDVPSQPTLVDLKFDGESQSRKVVIVPTKRGEIFLLDRETGELLSDVEERVVPQSDLDNERSAPTQPFSTEMPSFAYDHITEHDLFGITPFDQMACRIDFLNLRYEGPMTPPSVQGTLLYPGPAGGMNWGSIAVDEQRQLMVVNNMHLPFTVHMIPREEDKSTSEDRLNRGYGIGGPQRGTPYAAKVELFSSPLSLPCLKPPYSEIAVVDLTSKKIVWRRGSGLWELGLPHSAGSIVTSGGLIFQAGVMDGQLRAFDVDTGEVVWTDALRGPSDATPMTYVSPTSGKQYLIVTVPGDGRPPRATGHDLNTDGPTQPTTSGRIIAYTLP
ncbi:MAG: PQQ-binding-like beta-propeller repeat protein [Pseudomonadota bacterium]